MLDMIRNLLGKKSTTAQTLTSARNGIDLAVLARTVEELSSERSSALLEASDAEVAKIEERLAKAQRDLDRGHAALEELDRRIAIATQREALAEFRAARSIVEANAASAAAALRDRYPALAREIGGLVLAATAADRALRDWNNTRANNTPEGAGESDAQPVEHVEARLFTNYHPDGLNGSLICGIRLPLIDPDFAPGVADHNHPLRSFPMKLRAA